MRDTAQNSSLQAIPSSTVVGAFTVSARNGKSNEVFMGNDTSLPCCTCKEFQRTKWLCKHFFVVFKCFSEWTFDRLPEEYTKNPFITLDDRILSPIIASYTQQEDASPVNATAQWNQPDLDQSVDEFPDESNLDFTTEVMDDQTRPVSFSSSVNKKKGSDQANPLEEQRACRERLQVIRDKTYLLQDTTVLTRVRGLLDSIILDMQENLATENGVPLEPEERQKPIKKATGTKYLPLTKRKGKSKFSGRAGTKANIMRKTYMVNVPVTAPKTSELPNARNAKKATCDCGEHEIEIREEDNLPETPKCGEADDNTDPKFANASTFTDFLSSAKTDTLINRKDPSSESTGGKDPEIEQVLLSSPRTGLKRPAPQDNTHSNSHCASKTDIPSTKRQWQTIDDKENSDPNIDCQITGSAKSYNPRPKRRRQNLDSADLNLITNGEMLNDAVINKAQTLLHEQFPGVGGLEDTTLGPIFMFSVQKGEFVQVLHDGNSHWICISNIGCKENEINYYDSLRGSRVLWYLLQQIASIVHENGPQLIINPMKVQKQNNSVDCGLYALAFATSLVNGINPEDETFSIEELRPHLLKCLQEGKMKQFPRESETTHKRVRATTTVKLNLYCHCRMPWRPSDNEVRGMAMAECEICLKWFHQKCEKIPDSIFRDGGSWTCNDCTARN